MTFAAMIDTRHRWFSMSCSGTAPPSSLSLACSLCSFSMYFSLFLVILKNFIHSSFGDLDRGRRSLELVYLFFCLFPVVKEEECRCKEEHATQHYNEGAQHEGIS